MLIYFAQARIAIAQLDTQTNLDLDYLNVGVFKTSTINVNDTVFLDLTNATCVGSYFIVPVTVISDDVINAVDFSMKYNNTKITFNSIINYKPGYLNAAANFNTSDSILRFTSYSFTQAIEKNTPIAAVRFNLLNGPVITGNFNNAKAYLNGDKCTLKFIEAVLPTAIITPSGPTTITVGDSVILTANAGIGYSYFWSVGVTTQAIKVFTTATYTVTVTNIGGCTANTATNVLVGTPLPITLINFNARATKVGVNLTWITASESNNDFFTIEHSINSIHWEEIIRVRSKGNSNSLTNYACLDSNPARGINYYRLKQTDINGATNYLNTTKINFDLASNNNFELTVFPNPTTNTITIYSSQNVWTRLYNSEGTPVTDLMFLEAAMEKQIDIGLFSNGIYYLKVASTTNSKTEKIVILH